MNTVNERLKTVRKELRMSQEAMAAKLGITGAGISKMESCERNVTEQMIKSICREFGVSYTWFKYGEGSMFEEVDDMNAFIGRILADENETAKAAFRALAKLDESDWHVIKKLILSFGEELQK